MRPHMHIVTSSDDHHTVGGAGGGGGLRHAACGRRREHNGVGTGAVPIEGVMALGVAAAACVRSGTRVASITGLINMGVGVAQPWRPREQREGKVSPVKWP